MPQWIDYITNSSHANFFHGCSSKIFFSQDHLQIKTSFPLKPSLVGSGLDSYLAGKLLDFLALRDVLDCD